MKASIDADFGLVFKKTLSQNNGSWDWGPGGQKFENMPSL